MAVARPGRMKRRSGFILTTGRTALNAIMVQISVAEIAYLPTRTLKGRRYIYIDIRITQKKYQNKWI